MSSAWEIERGYSELIIAVIDTGVDLNHPDLKGKIWTNVQEIPRNGIDDDNNDYVDDVNGWNFDRNNNNPQDDNGHGTMISGVIAAETNNGMGVAGIVWNGKIMPIKTMDKEGSAYDTDVAEGLVYAVDNGAKIINLSFGENNPSAVIDLAVNYGLKKGCIIIAASGNEGNSWVYYPGAYPGVICVGAADENDLVPDYSNYGNGLDVVAPGENILSINLNSSYAKASGTSVAAAQVSGLAALLVSANLNLTPSQVEEIIERNAEHLPSGHDEWNQKYGYGRINAARTLASLKLERLAGRNRYLTSIRVSQDGWLYSNSIILASGQNFPDALSAGPLAYQVGGPILLTQKDTLPTEILNEIIRLKAFKVILIGGEGAISLAVENSLKEKGLSLERIEGKDRYETSSQIALKINLSSKKAILTSGEDFPDALAISSYAAKEQIPILFSKKDIVPQITKNTLSSLGISEIIIIGGEGVISSLVENNLKQLGYQVSRISGINRYETASKVAETFFSSPSYVFIASGMTFPDALVAGPLAAKLNSPVLLSTLNDLTFYTQNYLGGHSYQKAFIVGGNGVVAQTIDEKI